jgi:hypothetical protein
MQSLFIVMWSNEMFKITTQSILLRSLLSIGSCMAFLALTALPSRSQTLPTGLKPQPVVRLKSTPPLIAPLETLRTAGGLQGRALGFAARPSRLYQAFEQAAQSGKAIRPTLERLLGEATPAGRIYVAMLLIEIDPQAGRQALEQMRSDQTPITEASGCISMQTTVGAAVDDILQGRSSVFPPLSLKIPALRKEMSYPQARQLIINAGWQPRVTTTDNPQDGTKSWRDRGYNEVVACSGTGMGFCRFEFTGSDNEKLVVVTGGSKSTLQKWWEEPKNAAQ